MPLAPLVPLFGLTVHFIAADNDWSEEYFIRPDVVPPPLQTAAALSRLFLEFRRTWLASDVEMDYASVSSVDHQKDGFMVNLDGLRWNYIAPSALPQPLGIGPINDPKVALEYRVETAEAAPDSPAMGTFGTRQFSGIPDSWVTKNRWAVAPWGPPAAPPALGIVYPAYLSARSPLGTLQYTNATLASFNQVRDSMLALMINDFGILAKGLTPNDRTTWTVKSYARAIYRGVSSRRRGKSWVTSRARAKKSF